jgi:protein-S-isoprenylcysteine O-methyltransferase Ste14
MILKGLEQLLKHVPDWNTPLGFLRFLLLPILLFYLITAFFNPTRFPWPGWQLAIEILLVGVGFGSLYQFFRHRRDFKARFGPLAYSRAAGQFGLPGVTVIAALIARLRYLPGPEIPHFGGDLVLPGLGCVLTAAGTLLGLRTVLTFGVDYLTMVYVYFPEESQLANHAIYNILRHPAYAAVQFIAFGLALLNGSWAALAGALFFLLGLWGWVGLVEEKELIQRFGPAYVEYRKRVPAFWPHPRDLKAFFRFLIFGK